MTTPTPGLSLQAEPAGKTKWKITVKASGDVVFVDTISLSNASARKKFADALSEQFPGIAREPIDAELLRLAASGTTPSPSVDQLQEVDVRLVVRPELFHTTEVSGITIPVVFDVAGKLVSRWRMYLRWNDGRREAIDLPERVVLPGGSTLYIHPEPGEPPRSEPPGWSSDSRQVWLTGRAAPDPATTFQRVCKRIAHYLDFPPEIAPAATATLALWSMFSYVYPAWDAVPYLYIGGPTGSGKTRVLEILEQLVFRPTSTSNMTPACLFRTIHTRGGVLIYDEAEQLRQLTPEVAEKMSVLLAGYRKGGTATRLEPVGDSFRSTQFQVFGPKVLACIAGLPPILANRTIATTMFRSDSESPKPRRRVDTDLAEWESIRDDLHILALENGPTWISLAAWTDVVPAGIGGRAYQLWQPLLALGGWLQDRGADRLLELLRQHAVASVVAARDDAIPEADEVLLELLAEAVRACRPPTTADLLKLAKERDEVTFKTWGPKAVTSRLKTYGILTPKKTNGERRYRDVTPEMLVRIGERYGIDLGWPGVKCDLPTCP
jgi:hypothetical protein